jgi:hypothetical protein
MFARVLDQMKEPFMGSSPDTKGTRDIQNYFTNTLPNIIYNNDPKLDVVSLTEVSNTRISSHQDTLRQKWLQTDNNKKLLEKMEKDCKDNKGLDPFDRLTDLNATEDQSSRIRCGWIYNKTNPALGGGALGLRAGPISSKAPGVWNWDLGLATEQMHVDMCKGIQSCSDIDRVSLKQRCGWCERLQKGVPITKSGAVAYPWNKVGGCPASNTVTSGSKCPAKPPPDEDQETIPEVCDPLADGRISRNCVLNKYKDAGCSDKGSLGRALARGSDHDYMNSIYSQKAYQIYQARAPLALNEFGLKRGKVSVNDALNEFDRLASVASAHPSGGNALNFATRDLCLNQGEMDAFDFCTELKDTTVGPYNLDCLQKVFIKAGGEKGGLMYPSSSTMSKWNTFPNWKAVLDVIKKFKENLNSSNSDLRNDAIKQLLNANAGPWKVNVGNSGTHEKSVALPSGIPSTARNIKILTQGNSDEFVCRIDGNNLIVRRVDNHSGWGASYVAEISEGVLPNIPNIAFVRIEGGSEPLNVSQIVVLDENGKNISKGRPQQVNSEPFGDANRSRVNDGDERPRGYPLQYHGPGNKDLWQIKLDGTKKVSSVIIYNRSDCCQQRMASGYVIKLYAPNPAGGFREAFVSKKLNANLVQVVKMG